MMGSYRKLLDDESACVFKQIMSPWSSMLRRGTRLVYNKYKCIGRVCHTDRGWLVKLNTDTHTHT